MSHSIDDYCDLNNIANCIVCYVDSIVVLMEETLSRVLKIKIFYIRTIIM